MEPPTISSSGSTENQTKIEDKLRTRRIKEEKAIADLRNRIPDIDNIFNIHARIGNGTFSTVLLATLRCDEHISMERRSMFAVKHLIPTSHPSRIEKELNCLVEIGGVDNVVGIDLCLRRQESVAFVMPYLPHDRFNDYFDRMEVKEVQTYMKNLLIALKRVHSFNVIHRDVKPSNFLHSRKSGKFMLVDFGLAQTVVAGPVQGESPENSNDRKRKSNPSDPIAEGEVKKLKNSENFENPTESISNNPASPFKMPLKQFNEIITPKSSLKASPKQYDSPLTRQVKSVVLGVSMTSRLQQRVNNAPPSPQIKGKESESAGSSLSQTKYNTNRNLSSSSTSKCSCYGKNQVCNICLIKKDIPASRAGTPGYRPPEVLLKHMWQTTAVDVWAVGVIFISILSAVYPFFKAPDDFLALAEIVTIFGDESIRKTALSLNRHICMNRRCKPLDLQKLCMRLRNRFKAKPKESTTASTTTENVEECANCQQKSFDCLCANSSYKTNIIGDDKFPASAYSLLSRLLEVNPNKRITAEEALNHEFFQEDLS